ncbi:MAG: ankyrin repeat domain-containing protein [Gemmatimonadaceae bacterium]|nr:ankyrin repeat domain-containing protein [Gemmatimonadaceae bacterium]
MTDPIADFLVAATVPQDADHASGTLDRANELLAMHPQVAGANIYTAAVLGDEALVLGTLANDPRAATTKGGPHGWDALTYLCFSRFLQHDAARTEGFVGAATALLRGGASANTGFMTAGGRQKAEWESVLYGASGIAHVGALTRLLLEHGADANDDEVTYHTPETYDNAALRALIEHDTLTADSLATMLLRKCDWHDEHGIALLLVNGADPNRLTRWGYTALQQAIRRDNDLAIIARLLDAGGDPVIAGHGGSSIALAARKGRGDVLSLLEQRGINTALSGANAVLAACAKGDSTEVQALLTTFPPLHADVLARGGALLAEFAGIGNTNGVRALLDLGVPVDALDVDGNGYWDIAPRSTALHVAAWRGWPETVRLLVARGADVNARDGAGRSPLMRAVSACVDSYWMHRRSTASVMALLVSGATTDGVRLPCGDAELDALLLA